MLPNQDKHSFPEMEQKMPVLFVGHGSPMNAIEDNEYSQAWREMGIALPRPKAIVCISAHWETNGVLATAMEKPKTIHDFGGFPSELFTKEYPAPGSPEVARLVQQAIKSDSVRLDHSWGLDHGTWSVLCQMYPEADIPVIQLSLNRMQPPAYHYALGQELRMLRTKGILIVGSGNIVHNLHLAMFQNQAYDWAAEFDETLRDLILAGNHDAIVNYTKLGPISRQAIPTNEHFLPLLYILGLQEPGDPLQFFAEGVTMGSLSMRSIKIGA